MLLFLTKILSTSLFPFRSFAVALPSTKICDHSPPAPHHVPPYTTIPCPPPYIPTHPSPPPAGPWLPLAAVRRPAKRPVPHRTSRVATATVGMLRGFGGYGRVSKGLERRGSREPRGTAGHLGAAREMRFPRTLGSWFSRFLSLYVSGFWGFQPLGQWQGGHRSVPIQQHPAFPRL